MILKDEALKQRAEAVLGIKNETDESKISYAYHRKAFQYHPDRNPDDPNANDATALINESYKFLIGKEKPTLLEQDSLVELVSEHPLIDLNEFPTYEQWLIDQGYFDFCSSHGIKNQDKAKQKAKDERRLKICS